MKKNIIITGDVDFNDKDLLYRKLDAMTESITELTVLTSGRSKRTKAGDTVGAEYLAMQWASHRSRGKTIKIMVFHIYPHSDNRPDHLVNESHDEMLNIANGLIAITDGSDRETKKILKKAVDQNVRTKTVRY